MFVSGIIKKHRDQPKDEKVVLNKVIYTIGQGQVCSSYVCRQVQPLESYRIFSSCYSHGWINCSVPFHSCPTHLWSMFQGQLQ